MLDFEKFRKQAIAMKMDYRDFLRRKIVLMVQEEAQLIKRRGKLKRDMAIISAEIDRV